MEENDVEKVPGFEPKTRHKYTGGILLEPQPTDDPNDPLNFPFWQKCGILTILAYWAFLGTTNLIIVVGNYFHSTTYFSEGLELCADFETAKGPSFFDLAENYGASLTELSYTINGPLVAYGVGVR